MWRTWSDTFCERSLHDWVHNFTSVKNIYFFSNLWSIILKTCTCLLAFFFKCNMLYLTILLVVIEKAREMWARLCPPVISPRTLYTGGALAVKHGARGWSWPPGKNNPRSPWPNIRRSIIFSLKSGKGLGGFRFTNTPWPWDLEGRPVLH